MNIIAHYPRNEASIEVAVRTHIGKALRICSSESSTEQTVLLVLLRYLTCVMKKVCQYLLLGILLGCVICAVVGFIIAIIAFFLASTVGKLAVGTAIAVAVGVFIGCTFIGIIIGGSLGRIYGYCLDEEN